MYTYKCNVTRVIDGDTVDASIDLGYDITINKRIRLYGINTPECRTRDKEEKARGLFAKGRLIEILNEVNNQVIIHSTSIGKFGRVLGILYTDPTMLEYSCSVNMKLIKENLATEYYGK